MQLKWHDPEATLAEGIASRGDRRIGAVIERRVARRRHVPGVERALRRSTAGSTPWRPRASTSTGTCTGTAPRTRSCPWDHISAGLHKDFLWQDWQDALAEARPRRLPLDAVLRLRGVHRLRLEHVVASPVAAGGRQPGHRPGPRAAAARCPVAAPRASRRGGVRCAVTPGSRCASASPSAARSASPATATSPACWSGRSASRELPLAFTEGFSPRPKVQLRARALRPGTRATPSTSTSSSSTTGPTSTRSPRRLVAMRCPTGIDVDRRGRARRPGTRRCRRRSPPWRTGSTVVGADDAPSASTSSGRGRPGPGARRRSRSPASRKGSEVTDDVRPVMRTMAVDVDADDPAASLDARAGHPTARCPARRARSTRSSTGDSSTAPGAAHAPMDRARRRAAGAARQPTRAARRRREARAS